MILMYFSEVTEEEFRTTLEYAQPSAVVELRNTPRFDVGRLTRRQAFECFDRGHAKYIDLASSWMPSSHHELLVRDLKALFKDGSLTLDRPVMFLVGARHGSSGLVGGIASAVAEATKGVPEVYEVPRP